MSSAYLIPDDSRPPWHNHDPRPSRYHHYPTPPLESSVPTPSTNLPTQINATSDTTIAPSSCYTITTTTTPACPDFATSTCLIPLCIELLPRTVPCVDARCPTTGTETITASCTSLCRGGCATSYSTTTAACTSTTSGH